MAHKADSCHALSHNQNFWINCFLDVCPWVFNSSKITSTERLRACWKLVYICLLICFCACSFYLLVISELRKLLCELEGIN